MVSLELLSLEKFILKNFGLEITNVITHKESELYSGASFFINDRKIIFRKSKITPKKQGQFVTFWKRSEIGPIEPYHESDDFDFFLINCCTGYNKGLFIFPKDILIDKSIISTKHKEGKRAFRVYPTWEQPINKQALQTQFWQKKYFFLLSETLPNETIKSIF